MEIVRQAASNTLGEGTPDDGDAVTTDDDTATTKTDDTRTTEDGETIGVRLFWRDVEI